MVLSLVVLRLIQREGLRRGAFAGNDGECLPAADPGAGFHAILGGVPKFRFRTRRSRNDVIICCSEGGLAVFQQEASFRFGAFPGWAGAIPVFIIAHAVKETGVGLAISVVD